MKELEKNELMGVDGGGGIKDFIKKLTPIGIAVWAIDNWTEIKRGAYDGWNECHSTSEVDAVSYAG